MARFRHPEIGTVIECDGDLAEHYKALGWVDDERKVTRRGRKAKEERDAGSNSDAIGSDSVRSGDK